MTELSPAAQAVMDAYRANWQDERLKQDVKCLAAALRAAAQVIAEDEMEHYAPDILRDIAIELKGFQ